LQNYWIHLPEGPRTVASTILAGEKMIDDQAHGFVSSAHRSSLLAAGPNKAIIYTEAGEPYPALPTFVWTNTDTHGQPLGADCSGWTIAAILEPGALGTTTTESQWTDADIQPCQYAYPLYCFQGEE